MPAGPKNIGIRDGCSTADIFDGCSRGNRSTPYIQKARVLGVQTWSNIKEGSSLIDGIRAELIDWIVIIFISILTQSQVS